MKTAACKTSVNTGDSSGFAIQIPVLKVQGLNPCGITKEKGVLNMKRAFKYLRLLFTL